MTDIVERLNNCDPDENGWAYHVDIDLIYNAAEEITRLREIIAKLQQPINTSTTHTGYAYDPASMTYKQVSVPI